MDTLNRWQDRLEIFVGLWLCIAPWALALPAAAAWCSVAVGVAVIVLASQDLFLPNHLDDWANALLGVGLMISPWVWGYSGHENALLNALAMGLLVTLTSGWALERVLYDKFKVWRSHRHAH